MSKSRFSPGKAFISLIIVFALLLSTGVTTFAWLQIKKDTDVSISAGSGADITIYFATFDKTIGEKGEYVFDKGQSLSSNTTFGEKFSDINSNLHMGEIENLLHRDQANVSWYAFKIKTNGNRYFYNLRLSFVDSDPFDLVSIDGGVISNKIDQTDINNVKNNNLENLISSDNLIVTNVAPENFFKNFNSIEIPGAGNGVDKKDILDVNKENVLGDSKHITCHTALNSELNKTTGESYSGQYDNNDEYYYVYLRVYPNLDAYGESAQYISQYMPCVMTFNLQFEITTSSKPFSETNK